jgi:hypothetical protein
MRHEDRDQKGTTQPSPDARRRRKTTAKEPVARKPAKKVSAPAKAGARRATRATSPAKKAATRKPKSKKPRRGRPVGTIKLIPEKRLLLVTAIESGASDHAAARAAGIDPRTFRSYRETVEGRHPTRRPDRYLIELFKDIEEARARARIRREIELAQKDPKHWLRYQAPSLPGLPGWTTPVPEEPEESGVQPPYAPTPEELAAIVRIWVESGAIRNPFAEEAAASEPPEEDDPPLLAAVR